MPKLNKYQILKNDKLKKKVVKLYKEGNSTTAISKMKGINKSYEWVRLAVNEIVYGKKRVRNHG